MADAVSFCQCAIIEFLVKEEVPAVDIHHSLQHVYGRKITLQHNNAWPNTAHLTLEKTENMRWEVLPHTLYSSDLAPSDYHFFGFVKIRCEVNIPT